MITISGTHAEVDAILPQAVEAARSAPPSTVVLMARLPGGDVLKLRTFSAEDVALFGSSIRDTLMAETQHWSHAEDDRCRFTEGAVTYEFLVGAMHPTTIMHDVAKDMLGAFDPSVS